MREIVDIRSTRGGICQHQRRDAASHGDLGVSGIDVATTLRVVAGTLSYELNTSAGSGGTA